MTIRLQLAVVLFFSVTQAFSQFSMSGEVRPRTEYTHGFGKLASPTDNPGIFTTQRTRLNMNYKSDSYNARIVLQDVRTWGGQRQLVMNDGLASIQQAWFDLKLTDKLRLKAGRQELSYDDHRILGNVGWAQQARTHDVALFKFQENLHIGFAYNDNATRGLLETPYTVPASYKAMQYIWYHMDSDDEKVGLSVLALNNGKERQVMNANDEIISQTTEYSQTIGGRLTMAITDKLGANSNAYYQMGLDGRNNEIEAYLASVDLTYKMSDKTALTVGFERQSGNSQLNQAAGTNTAFTPFYGTNHKFNGLMDYFYVGNHMNSVGLQDNFLKVVQKVGENSKLIAMAHNFSSVGAVNDGTGNAAGAALGNEIDLVYVKPIGKDANIKMGYSQLFGTNTMELLKGGDLNETQNWAWVMLTVKPKFIN